MQIFHTLPDLRGTDARLCIALGTFDGVHIGHQNILRQAIALAAQTDGTSAVFTFSNHPLGLVAPEKCPARIIDNADKEAQIAALGVELLIHIPFTRALLRLSPADFIALLAGLAPVYVVTGPNYSFGYRGMGNPQLLAKLGARCGFSAVTQPVVTLDGAPVSSTRIRRALKAGHIADANRALGRPFRLRGAVVRGDQRGRTLGFPTANVDFDAGMAIPKNGVYAVRTAVGKNTYPSVANVGTNPTFDGAHRHMEVHLFDFSDDIYGAPITVDFFAKLRDEKRFATAAALVRQIEEDKAAARQLLGNH